MTQPQASPTQAPAADLPTPPSGPRPPLFPAFLDLDRRPCLVVGAGSIGWEKALGLLECGARVTVIDPRLDPLADSDIDTGTSGVPGTPDGPASPGRWDRRRLRLRARPFEPRDLDGQFLVVAATRAAPIQSLVQREAAARGVLCNVVDVPVLCDFVYGARLRRGALQIAVTTGGRFPILAQRLRDLWNADLPANATDALDLLGRARDRLRRRGAGFAANRLALRELFDDDALALVRAGDLDGLQQRIEQWNSSHLL